MIEHILIPEERMRKLRKDEKWRTELKKFSEAKIELNEGITIESDDSIQVLRLKEVIKAYGRGFAFKDSLDLLDEEFVLETMDVREFTGKSKKRQIVLKGRVIGTQGKTKGMVEMYTETKIAVYGKTVSIIGRWKDVRMAKEAISMLLSGSMHNTVYRFLETSKVGK
jgi:ribosomal RNA assembly protein